MNKHFLAVCIFGLIMSSYSSWLVAQEELSVGDEAPDFAAATFDDGTVTLSDRFGEKGNSTILIFSRANW